MCVICGAVPAVVAAGIAADGKQRQHQNEAARHSEYPIRALTVLAVLALFLVSAIYHIFQPSG